MGRSHMLFLLDMLYSVFDRLVLLLILLTMLRISIEFFEFLDKKLKVIMKNSHQLWSLSDAT